jgi:hypothetical protein
MNQDQEHNAGLLTAIRIARVKADEFFAELEVELSGTDSARSRESTLRTEDAPWRLDVKPIFGDWTEVGRDSDQTYRWPDGNVDVYSDFVRFAGEGGFKGINTAIGYKDNGEVIGFILGGNDKRGLVFFQQADDFEQSGQLLSMVRGGGDSGKAGFSPDGPEPPAYANLQLENLRDRIEGKWNVLAVVAKPEDTDAILTHTALQARLRGLA